MTVTTVGSGIGGSLAMVPETAGQYGKVVGSPPWIFFEPNDQITAKKIKNTKQSMGLAAGRLVPIAARRVVTSRGASLAWPVDWCQANRFSTLLNQLSSTYAAGAAGSQAAATGIWSAGARVTPSGATYAYAHTFRNDIAGRSAAFQIGVPTTDATLRQFDILGAKPTKFAWSVEKDSLLTCATDWDARVYEDPTLTAAYEGYPNGSTQTPYTQAVPSYTVGAPYHWAQGQIQIGATAAAASTATPIDGVTKFQLSVEHKLNVSRQYLGNAGLKDEQLVNAEYVISGVISSDYMNKQYFADPYYTDGAQSVIVTLAPGALSGTTNAIQFVLNNVFEDADSPLVANKDLPNTSFAFVALYDQVNEPLTTIIQTTDATI